MRRSWSRRTLSILATVITLLAMTATPAHADPYWQTPGDSTYWNCGLPEFSSVYGGGYYVRHKTCIVVNGNYTQAVVIVENYAGYAITIEAPQVQLYQAPGKLIYNRFCHESTLNSGRTTACFGPTTRRACGTRVQAQAVVTYGRAEALQANSLTTEMCT